MLLRTWRFVEIGFWSSGFGAAAGAGGGGGAGVPSGLGAAGLASTGLASAGLASAGLTSTGLAATSADFTPSAVLLCSATTSFGFSSFFYIYASSLVV